MKRLLLILSIIALVLPAIPTARAADVSVDFFYDNLSGGNWIEVGAYGYCWQPDVAVNNPRWRPYADGYWVFTNLGWTWVSYEDFGWATYHYGRWVRLADIGWVWVPGDNLEWGPAWVSWRTGGDRVGWAPLPPRRPGISFGFSFGRTIGSHVDVDLDIGPDYYNFVDVRYIGEPALRERIYETSSNVTYIQQTVNVTNITYKDKTVYNYGPDYATLNARSSRPIQKLQVEHQANVDVAAAAKSGALTKVQGDKLVVAAPMEIKKPAQQVAPPAVKTKIKEVKIDKGWSSVSDPKAQEELKQKIKTEDASKIPPATAGASPGQAAGAASPAVSPSATVSPALSPQLGKPGKGKGGELQNTPASPAAAPTATPATTPLGGKDRGNLERGPLAPTPAPGEESSKTNLNSSKSNLYKAATPPPNINKEKEAGLKDLATKKEKERQAPAGVGAAAGGERGKVKAAEEEGGKKKEKKGAESPAPTPQ
jgi:hypothetical protein